MEQIEIWNPRRLSKPLNNSEDNPGAGYKAAPKQEVTEVSSSCSIDLAFAFALHNHSDLEIYEQITRSNAQTLKSINTSSVRVQFFY